MRLSHLTVLILLMGIIMIGGCNTGTKTPTNGPYSGGVNGVAISFLAAAPTPTFNKGDSVPVKVLLKNNGEFDIASGEAQVKIYGIHHPSFGLSDQFKATSGELLGLNNLRTEGGEQQIDMGSINYNQDIVGSEKFTLNAEVCYPYMTDAILNACITTNKIEASGSQKSCTIQTGKSTEKIAKGDVSGAPVQVTSITEELKGTNRVMFHITVENKGKGRVFKYDAACADLEKVEQTDISNIVSISTPEDVQCILLDKTSNSGDIRLTAGKKIVDCYKDVTETNSYAQKIDFKLKYKYLDTTSLGIEIYQTMTAT
jgi:hypothetical protein